MAYTTRKTLLNGVHQGDNRAWEQFWDFYRPLIRICGHDYKLTEDEIKDLQQEVLIEVFQADVVGKYNSQRGRFRDYLRTIIQRKIFGIFRKRFPPCEQDDILAETESTIEELWDEEWHAFLLEAAIDELKERVSETTFLAYDLYANQGMPPDVVASMLSINANQVYIAKTRCVQLLKEIIEKLKSDDSL